MGDYDTIWVFLKHSFSASFFSVSSEEVSVTRFMEDWSDFSVFPKLVKDLKFIWESKLEALWKLLVTCQVVANFLILLIKLIASLPKHLGFKCNPPLLSSFEVIFSLPIRYVDWNERILRIVDNFPNMTPVRYLHSIAHNLSL